MERLLLTRINVLAKLVTGRKVPSAMRRVSTFQTTEKPTKECPERNILPEDVHSYDNERKIGITRKEQKELLRKMPAPTQESRILKVAIIGAPNAGKSTLANKLIGWKFAPVSGKVHTTRQKTLGVLTEENKQVIFLDTPGIIEPKKRKRHNLENSLLVDPHSAVFEADLIAVVVDISHTWHRSKLEFEVQKILHLHPDRKSILVMNKVDLVKDKRELLGIARTLTEGVVAGAKNWTTPKQKQMASLDELFQRAKEKRSREASTTFASGLSNAEPGSPNSEHDNEQTFSYQGADGTTVTVLGDPQFLEDEQDDDTTELNQQLTLQRRSASTDKTLDLEDPSVWSLYYRKINKIGRDLEDRRGWPHFDQVFMISALNNDGIYELKDYLLNETYHSPLQYHPSFVTNQHPLALARLCIFERMLDHLPDEIPYQIQVRLALWEVTEDDLLRVAFDLICTKQRHMHYLFGKDGSTIRTIASEAKQELMNAFRRELSLQLVVKGSKDTYHKE